MIISGYIEDLYKRLIAIDQASRQESALPDNIAVDAIASKLALLYEKIRTTMDYQEEHLLRRFALERNIRRRIILESFEPKVAQSMVEELIRSGYLPNKAIPQSLVQEIEPIIGKYQYLIDLIHGGVHNSGERRKILGWLAGIIACEIDLVIVPELRVDALIETLYSIVKNRIKFRGENISIREKNIQLYITIHKELVRSDNAIIAYHLFYLYFPGWSRADRALVEYVASKITSIHHGIQLHIDNPIRSKIAKSLRKHIVVFKIFRELVELHREHLIELLANPDFFESEARHVIERNNKSIRRRLRRSSVRAVLYIFITKVALALILEYPYDMYVVRSVNYVALSINILFPPLLMFLLTLTARLPRAQNTKLILDELRDIVYGDPETNILCELRVRKKQGPVYFFFEYLFYMLLYGFIFGVIIYVLSRLHFNLLSGGIFIFFVTAVSFFGSRIRQLTQEYSVEGRRESFSGFVITFFSLPVVRAGHWLSVNMRRINIFAFVLDFIIEAPFKVLIELIESWFIFLREKRDDTYKTT